VRAYVRVSVPRCGSIVGITGHCEMGKGEQVGMVRRGCYH